MKGGHTHYYASDPASPHRYALAEAVWEGTPFVFRTDSGVFSRHRVDPGTDLLIKTVLASEPDRPARALDLGTGAGVMAIVLARLRPSLSVTGSDINKRAMALAACNARTAGVSEGLTLIESDGVPGGTFDLVVTNPPIRAGKETVYRLFREVADSLAPAGAFYVVIRVKQGAASARRELEDLFRRVETVARGKGYHVLKASGGTPKGSDAGQLRTSE